VTVADQLHDLAVIRQLLMERLIAGQQRDMQKLLDQIAQSIERKLKGPELSEAQARRVNQTIAELKAAVRIGPPDLSELAVTEAVYLQTKLAKIGIGTALPTEAALARISSRPLVQGAALGAWFSNLEDTLRFDIERIVRIGVSIGRSNRDMAKEILGNGSDRGTEAFARTRRNAMALTRTATQTVTNDARMAFYDGNDDIFKGVQWVSTLDNRTSVQCMALAGLVWTLPYLEPEGHDMPWAGPPPAHWNCFPADTAISAGGAISNASKRWFDGYLCVIRTASGNKISCTPNHPILTNRGWVAAHLINEGDQVATGALAEREAVREWDDKNIIPSIRDVTEAFFRSGKMLLVPMPTTAKDFHGDGIDGEVAIVGADGLLPNVTDPRYIKAISERIFINGCPARPISLISRGHLATFFNGCNASPSSSICGGCELLTRGEIGSFHPGVLLLTAIAQVDPVFAQDALNNLDRYLELFKDTANSNPLIVNGNDFAFADRRIPQGFNSNSFRPWQNFNAGLSQPSMSDIDADAKLTSDLRNGKHGAVSFDNVVYVGKKYFSGHVYNLETEHGYYTANGIIVHNCRSTVIGVARSIAELTGKRASQIAPRTRASMDGSVAQDISFDEWLRRKPKSFSDEMLGKGRAELWRDKKITLQQLLDQRGNPISVRELLDKYS
jgi:hypothetical protein